MYIDQWIYISQVKTQSFSACCVQKTQESEKYFKPSVEQM